MSKNFYVGWTSLLVVICSAVIFFHSCSNVNIIVRDNDVTGLYTPEFLKKIDEVKMLYAKGKKVDAQNILQKMPSEKLLPTEKSLRLNLLGVINFSNQKIEKSIELFTQALQTSSGDKELTAQIKINLMSSNYKLGFVEKAFEIGKSIEYDYLAVEEYKKGQMLRYKIARDLNNYDVQVESLTLYLKDVTTLDKLKEEQNFLKLKEAFDRLDSNSKKRFLGSHEESKFLVVGYLGYLEMERVHFNGEKELAKDYIEWLVDNFDDNKDVENLIAIFQGKIGTERRIDAKVVGVVLPLSGKKKNFGEKSLLGIDFGLKNINQDSSSSKIILSIKDSNGSGAVGALRVRELIEKEHVSAIIGGLFSGEAEKEYLEARKYGVLFISLSPILLSRNEKNYLLVEIPGSVESQIESLLSEESLKRIGKKGAILHAKDTRGQAFLELFWERANNVGAEVVEIQSYDKNDQDFRVPVKRMLGLEYTRERDEEKNLWDNVYSAEKSTSIKRIQTLRPQVDFDWVFLPAFPQEALQIAPLFAYYDAFKMKIIGGPSWRNELLAKESKRIGQVYFLGDDYRFENNAFIENFAQIYKKVPKLVELRAYDSITVLGSVLVRGDYNSREDFDAALLKSAHLAGITGEWNLKDNLWLKSMPLMQIKNEKIINTISGKVENNSSSMED